MRNDLYARYGILECWLVDPAKKKIEILTLSGKKFSAIGIYGIKDALSQR